MTTPEDQINKFREDHPEIVAVWRQFEAYCFKDAEIAQNLTKPKPKKKKHNWMSGFCIGKPTADIDRVRYESIARMQDAKNKLIKYK